MRLAPGLSRVLHQLVLDALAVCLFLGVEIDFLSLALQEVWYLAARQSVF